MIECISGNVTKLKPRYYLPIDGTLRGASTSGQRGGGGNNSNKVAAQYVESVT